MSALIYYLALPFIYLLSILPFRVLYFISNGVYFLLYRVLGYRRQVVFDNLKNSFPEKTDAEINAISKRYYKYLCDLFLETFKTLTISKATMQKHCYFTPEAKALFDKMAAEK